MVSPLGNVQVREGTLLAKAAASSPVRLLCRNMATSLIEHERIKTTLPKAKELRRVMDRLVTKGKAGVCAEISPLRLRPHARLLSDTVHKRKQIAAYVREDSAVDKLFSVLGPRYL